MKCLGWKHERILKAAFCLLLGALLGWAPSTNAAIIVDDSWTDGGRNDGPDPLDINWWTSANANGIEVSVGSMGLVTGTAGRGIHGIFPTQTLANVGDRLTATYTFTTPATVGTGGTGGFRVGLFDTLGRTALNANITSSSSIFEPAYGYHGAGTAALPGYMMEMDVGTGAEDFSFREHSVITVPGTSPTGRLMGTTAGFASLSPTGPDGVYAFAPNTTYTGSFTITRFSATEMELTATLGTESHTITDVFDSASYGMIAFWVNSNLFGSSSAPNTANNGIDFSNIRIEFFAVPEASSIVLAVLGMLGALAARWSRRV
jgi:hypothetical protein